MMLRIAVGAYLFIHGLCHVVGFIVPWKIVELREEPYKTTLLLGAVDIGDIGIRIIGAVWLMTAVAFVACAVGSFVQAPWWRSMVLYLSIFSAILCILGLPGAKIGILANAVIIIYLLAGPRFGWVQ